MYKAGRPGSARLARLGAARLGAARRGSARPAAAWCGGARRGGRGAARLGSPRLASARRGRARLGALRFLSLPVLVKVGPVHRSLRLALDEFARHGFQLNLDQGKSDAIVLFFGRGSLKAKRKICRDMDDSLVISDVFQNTRK